MNCCQLLTLSGPGVARAATITYYDEGAFKLAAVHLTKESFETIAWDSWIYRR